MATELKSFPAETSDASCVAERVLASLRKHGIEATPENYAIWYEYHAGTNPSLQTTIDALVFNSSAFDEKTLHDLTVNFLSIAKEKEAMRDTSSRILGALKEVICLTQRARRDADEFGAALRELPSAELGQTIDNLQGLIQELVQESQRVASRSEYVSIQMRESADRIESLEHNLQDALRDATIDGLTGIANRRFFDQEIRRLAANAMNTGDELSLLMIDIDHFKRVNDVWGHPMGDLVLSRLAASLKLAVRGEDLVARYGGEEFAVLLPRTGLGSAISVGENIRRFLTVAPVRIDSAPSLERVTVSIGAATYDCGEPLADWIARADESLYHAKQAGRNCVRSG